VHELDELTKSYVDQVDELLKTRNPSFSRSR